VVQKFFHSAMCSLMSRGWCHCPSLLFLCVALPSLWLFKVRVREVDEELAQRQPMLLCCQVVLTLSPALVGTLCWQNRSATVDGLKAMVRPLFRHVLVRGGASWVSKTLRQISSGGVRVGAGLQQQAGTTRGEFCGVAEKAVTAAGCCGASGSRALNGAAQLQDNDRAQDVNGYDSNGHTHGVNGMAHIRDIASHAASRTGAAAEQQLPGHRDPRQHARDVILGGAAALQRLAAAVDDSFDRAVALIEGRAAGARVLVVGIGKSGHLARKISATLSSTGTASFFMHGTEALHGDLGGAQVASWLYEACLCSRCS